MSKLILVMGLPGSGKTTLVKQMKGKKIHVDDLRKVLTGSYIPNKEENPLVYKAAQAAAAHYLERNQTVIIDALFLSKASRKPYLDLAKRYRAFVEVHWLNLEMPELLNRVQKRNELNEPERNLNESYVYQLATLLDLPTKEEGIDSIIHI
jgi:predicted kinase